MKSLSFILVATLAASAPLAAHDFWIEPLAFEVAAGKPVAVRLKVGEKFDGETVMPRPGTVSDFSAHDAAGSRLLETPALPDVAGIIATRQAGLLAIAYESRPSAVTLSAQRFEHYLREEGLEHVVTARARQGASALPGRELFARSAKSMVRVGDDGSRGPMGLRALGLPLEFVTSNNPYSLAPGSSLNLELLYRGQPAAGVLVVAFPKANPENSQRGRTDRAGRITVDLDQPGAWLVKAVRMDTAPPESDADWMSWWASLTFSIPES